MHNKKRVAFLLTELLVISLLLFLFLKTLNINEFRKYLKILKPQNILVILLFQFSVQLLGSVQWRILMRQAEVERGFFNILKARISGYSVSYLTPSLYIGGEPVRAGMIKDPDTSYNKIYATVTLDKYIELFTKFPAIVTGLSFMIFFFNPKPILIVISAILMLSLIASFFFVMVKLLHDRAFIKRISKKILRPIIKSNPRIAVKIYSFIKAFEREITLIIHEKKYFYLAMTIGLTISMIEVCQTYYILCLMQFPSMINAFIIFGSSLFLAIFTIIPANLGGMEGVNLFIFSLLKMGPERGLTYTIILRLGHLSFVAIGLTMLLISRIQGKQR